MNNEILQDIRSINHSSEFIEFTVHKNQEQTEACSHNKY